MININDTIQNIPHSIKMCFYTIEGVFLDIIINIDYLIEFQVPVLQPTKRTHNDVLMREKKTSK